MRAPQRPSSSCQRVLVGLSGGVDSSVAALLLKEEGYEVTGVTLRLWSDPVSKRQQTGCSPDSAERAAAVAHHLDIPHLVVDGGEIFDREVVGYFVAEYAQGRTPNPCVKCNATVKLPLLLETAQKLGTARIATGHYARLTGSPPRLSRGVDSRKDQSYFLAQVAAPVLEQVLFPLGGMTKVQVRRLAAARGLGNHPSDESQDICFTEGHDYRGFLERRLGARPGVVVNSDGKPLGHHSGTYNYTVGQRKGLGVGGGDALYVLAVDSARAEVIAGPETQCAVGSVRISHPVVHRTDWGANTTVQVRSMGEPIPAHLTADNMISLECPATGVAAGQNAVFYDGDNVVLAGTIIATERWGRHSATPISAGPE